MQPAIRIADLGKRFRVHCAQERASYHTLRDSLARAAAAPWRRLRGENSGISEEFWALKDVTFDIHSGEVVGIIGRNGAGKSTLLKILSRITKPTTGEVEINGRVGSLLEVGTGFHPELSGRENIYMNGSILGMSRREIRRRFDAIVEFSEVEKFLDMPVKRYSSGMYVRLAFAVAAHLEPEILVVDEVLAVGDAAFQEKCLGKLREVGTQGRTVILVSHNMHAVSRLTKRAVFLREGKLVHVAPTPDVVAEYLGTPSGSEIDWRVLRVDPRKVLQLTAIEFRNPIKSSSGSVDADNPFELIVTFSARSAVNAQIAVRLNSNSDGSTVFTSALSDQSGRNHSRFPPGTYAARCYVPGHFLRPGKYHLLVAANNPHGHQFDLVERALCFEISSIGSLIALDNRLGHCVPLLRWDLQQIDG